MCKNLIMGPAKLIEVSLAGYYKDSITRKRWLGFFVPAISPRVSSSSGSLH